MRLHILLGPLIKQRLGRTGSETSPSANNQAGAGLGWRTSRSSLDHHFASLNAQSTLFSIVCVYAYFLTSVSARIPFCSRMLAGYVAAVRNDARETREAISEILNDEDTLQSLCLSQVCDGALRCLRT